MGAVTSGYIIWLMTDTFEVSSMNAYRSVIIIYAIFGAVKAFLYLSLSKEVEVENFENQKKSNWFNKSFGLHQSSSRRTVAKLSALFLIDSIAGGFILQTTIVYWFHIRFQMNTDKLGLMMMLANIISGISAILSTILVGKLGAIKTMVITHVSVFINTKKFTCFIFRFHQIYFYC
jgi:hypothetical protein